MTTPRERAVLYGRNNQNRFLENLKHFAAIPSISTSPSAVPDIHHAAEWAVDHLKRLGAQPVEVYPTQGHPIVYGELYHAGPNARTVLIYGHYDVQPPEPLELWISGAFEPSVRGDYIYGRGVCDMKGQILAATHAIEAILSASDLPVNIKFLFEGEEEIGSPNLEPFIVEQKDMLTCDLALNPDTGTLTPDDPTITYALRGLAFFELCVRGPDHDLHSGIFGGTVHNPAVSLGELIAGMHDTHRRVTLPGFYDQVRSLDEEERSELSRLPLTPLYYLENTGAPALWCEEGYTPVECATARPTLEVNGMQSGFTGEGTKTVLPSWAMAKISCRLVPDQEPEEVHHQMLLYLQRHAPPTIRWELTYLGGGKAFSSDRHSTGVQALSQAMETVWGKRPLFKREGGSVPVVGFFHKHLGVESVNTGFSMPGDNLHSPNEKLHLPTWRRGTEAFIHFFYNLAKDEM